MLDLLKTKNKYFDIWEALMNRKIYNITNKNICVFSKKVLISFLLFASLIYSQELDNDIFGNQSKLSLSFYLATTVGGPSKQIENAMRTSGFNDDSWWSSGKNYPFSRFNGIPWMIETQYRLNKSVSVGFQISNSILWETLGYANPQVGFGEYLSLNYSTMSYSPIVSFHFNEYIILGIGPSFNTLKANEFSSSHIQYFDENDIKLVDENKIGMLAHLNLRIHISSLFSGNLIFQYRYIGSTNIGPIVKENTIGITTPTPSTVTITFPETEINYNHLFIGLGLGVHL